MQIICEAWIMPSCPETLCFKNIINLVDKIGIVNNYLYLSLNSAVRAPGYSQVLCTLSCWVHMDESNYTVIGSSCERVSLTGCLTKSSEVLVNLEDIGCIGSDWSTQIKCSCPVTRSHWWLPLKRLQTFDKLLSSNICLTLSDPFPSALIHGQLQGYVNCAIKQDPELTMDAWLVSCSAVFISKVIIFWNKEPCIFILFWILEIMWDHLLLYEKRGHYSLNYLFLKVREIISIDSITVSCLGRQHCKCK